MLKPAEVTVDDLTSDRNAAAHGLRPVGASHCKTSAFPGLAALACLLVATSAPDAARAFDCVQAKTALERGLCSDPLAKAADDAMGAAFAKLKQKRTGVEASDLLADQREWLKSRNLGCADDKAVGPCLRRADEARARALDGTPDAGPGLPRALSPVLVRRPRTSKAAEIDVFLYRFQSPASAAEVALNAATDAQVAEVKTAADEAGGIDGAEVTRRATIAYGSDRLLSIAVDAWAFTGGMHGNASSDNVNIDMRAGRVLSAKDLIADADRGKLTQLCLGQVSDQLKRRLLEDGQNPDKDADAKTSLQDARSFAGRSVEGVLFDLKNWSFRADGASVAFDPDEVAPYVFGALTCSVPYATLRPLAKPGFPLP